MFDHVDTSEYVPTRPMHAASRITISRTRSTDVIRCGPFRDRETRIGQKSDTTWGRDQTAGGGIRRRGGGIRRRGATHQSRHQQVQAHDHSHRPPALPLTAVEEHHAPEGVEEGHCQGHAGWGGLQQARGHWCRTTEKTHTLCLYIWGGLRVQYNYKGTVLTLSQAQGYT